MEKTRASYPVTPGGTLTYPQLSTEMGDRSVPENTADSNKPCMSSRSSFSWQAARPSKGWLTLLEVSASSSSNSSASSMWLPGFLRGFRPGAPLRQTQTKMNPLRRKKVDPAEPQLPTLLHKQAHSLTRVGVFTEVKSESKPHMRHYKSFALKGVNRGVFSKPHEAVICGTLCVVLSDNQKEPHKYWEIQSLPLLFICILRHSCCVAESQQFSTLLLQPLALLFL